MTGKVYYGTRPGMSWQDWKIAIAMGIPAGVFLLTVFVAWVFG